MWTNSIMNFPSLYFWLCSYACSYFHPNVVLHLKYTCFTSWWRNYDVTHLWQWISATWWRPVRRTLCSAGPEAILTTESNKYARPCEPWKLFDIKFTWDARWARQWTQLKKICQKFVKNLCWWKICHIFLQCWWQFQDVIDRIKIDNINLSPAMKILRKK